MIEISETTKRDLRRRVEEIGRARVEVQARLDHLASESDAINTLLGEWRSADGKSARTRPDALRAALKQLGTASPKEVSERMTEEGWEWNGVNPIQTAGVELNRLSKMPGGGVERVARGQYQCKE